MSRTLINNGTEAEPIITFYECNFKFKSCFGNDFDLLFNEHWTLNTMQMLLLYLERALCSALPNFEIFFKTFNDFLNMGDLEIEWPTVTDW